MLTHCCFALLFVLIPALFAVCQCVTTLAFERSWRIVSLVPVAVVVLLMAILVRDGPFFAMCCSSACGLLALMLV